MISWASISIAGDSLIRTSAGTLSPQRAIGFNTRTTRLHLRPLNEYFEIKHIYAKLTIVSNEQNVDAYVGSIVDYYSQATPRTYIYPVKLRLRTGN